MLVSVAALVFLVLLGGYLFMTLSPQFGEKPSGERLERIEASPNYRDGKFQNLVPTHMSTSGNLVETTFKFFFGGEQREPEAPMKTVRLDTDAFASGDGLEVAWLGHSSVLVRIDGYVVLLDPVLGDRISPVPFLSPTAFPYTSRTTLEDLPEVDVVVISHDHFDHLDYETIIALSGSVERFYMPLGVGARVEGWGVDPGKIVELDWWQEERLGDLTLTATPARHFSGRRVDDSMKTQWASWVIAGPEHGLFFSGDSGYFDGFAEIGEKLGPFDVTLLECGAYDERWALLHMMPEQTVQAHVDLGGGVLVPIHWGRFNLALHPWTEPIERLTAEASARDLVVATPRPGEVFDPGGSLPEERWWSDQR